MPSIRTLAAGLCLLGCAGSGCQKDADTLTTYSCFTDAPLVKPAKNLVGIVFFDDTEQHYAIARTIPGTYDSEDVGFVCALPKSLQQDGKQVVFTGTYRAYTGTSRPILGGQTYYYLDLTQVEAQ